MRIRPCPVLAHSVRPDLNERMSAFGIAAEEIAHSMSVDRVGRPKAVLAILRPYYDLIATLLPRERTRMTPNRTYPSLCRGTRAKALGL